MSLLSKCFNKIATGWLVFVKKTSSVWILMLSSVLLDQLSYLHLELDLGTSLTKLSFLHNTLTYLVKHKRKDFFLLSQLELQSLSYQSSISPSIDPSSSFLSFLGPLPRSAKKKWSSVPCEASSFFYKPFYVDLSPPAV